jgi:glycogen(starch) synthase
VRVLIVSWEYPPVIVGGLGRHVADLADALTALGHDIRVLTRGSEPRSRTETINGVPVTRAAVDQLNIDFSSESVLAWTQAFEHALIRAGLTLLESWQPDVIHGHDWLVAQTTRTLHERCGAPVVATIHATEYGRQQGWLGEPVPRAIHSVERWLCQNAAAVITCSQFMADQVADLFDLQRGAIAVIGNGIDPGQWQRSPAEVDVARSRYRGDGPLVAFAGRFVHEKGLQELIKALPLLATDYPGLAAVLVGRGPDLAAQQDRAVRYGVADLISWPGFLDGGDLAAVLAAADVVVVPSLYEPFGLIALEAQAAGTPVAVSDTGGLRDLVVDGQSGVRFEPESTMSLMVEADATTAALPARCRRSRLGSDLYSAPRFFCDGAG